MKTQTERGIRFDISCEVCRDLMPLVRDGVASADSEALVRAHTERCGGCRTMLESETPPEHSMPDDARVLRRLRWRLLAQSVLFALVGVLGALWLTSRAGTCILHGGCRWWARRVIMSCGAGAGWCRLQRRRLCFCIFLSQTCNRCSGVQWCCMRLWRWRLPGRWP